ncbi:MAG: hypothetical protein JW765_13335 [Deltaproteobacteria bacterium]|nr:hypothetical protein [Candidatus Zymogenaceae bacterium]
MNLYIYIPTKEIQESLFIQLIGKEIPQFQIEIFRSIEDLKARLKQPRYIFTTAVIFAPDSQDVSDIISLEHFLRDVQIILIISHDNHGTLSMAHYLRPRFIGYFSLFSKEINAREITSVLRKMLKHHLSLSYVAE